MPRGVRIASIGDALYLPVQMPWIDPLKEAEAMALMEDHAFMSGQEIIRRRGADPNDVLDQQAAWLERKKLWGIPAPSNASGFRLGSDAGAGSGSDPGQADPKAPPPGVDPNAFGRLSPRAYARRRRFLSDNYSEETP
jgi:capsid protein